MKEWSAEIPAEIPSENPLFENLFESQQREIIIFGKYWFSRRFRVTGTICDCQIQELEDETIQYRARLGGGEVHEISNQSALAKVLRFFFRK